MPKVRVLKRDVLSYARNVDDVVDIADVEVIKDLVADGVVEVLDKLPVKKVSIKKKKK